MIETHTLEQLDSKKAREKKILDLVYSDRGVSEILSSERPDFIIRLAEGAIFGVEITELYGSQTDARIERIPNYCLKLLSGGNFLHRDDAQKITVGKIDILSETNEVVCSQVEAIIREAPSPAEFARRLGAAVRSKADKLTRTDRALSHVNLIVHDRTNILGHIPREDFFRLCFLPDLRTMIAAAPFREVFFLAKMKDESGFVPFKMLLLMAEAFFFNKVYASMANKWQRFQTVTELEVLASYLAEKVQGPVLYREAEDGMEVIFGDSGFFVAPDRSVAIRMYQDGTYPRDARRPNTELVNQLDAEFKAALAECWISNTLVTPLLFCTERFDG